jgi:hypothetical protein
VLSGSWLGKSWFTLRNRERVFIYFLGMFAE